VKMREKGKDGAWEVSGSEKGKRYDVCANQAVQNMPQPHPLQLCH
jgi:hypothetical protein